MNENSSRFSRQVAEFVVYELQTRISLVHFVYRKSNCLLLFLFSESLGFHDNFSFNMKVFLLHEMVAECSVLEINYLHCCWNNLISDIYTGLSTYCIRQVNVYEPRSKMEKEMQTELYNVLMTDIVERFIIQT